MAGISTPSAAPDITDSKELVTGSRPDALLRHQTSTTQTRDIAQMLATNPILHFEPATAWSFAIETPSFIELLGDLDAIEAVLQAEPASRLVYGSASFEAVRDLHPKMAVVVQRQAKVLAGLSDVGGAGLCGQGTGGEAYDGPVRAARVCLP